MTTQTLRGLAGTDPLHWRGDRESFNHFNGAFVSLLGGSLLSAADMAAFREFIDTIAYQPNPNQQLDRSLPATFAGGDPAAGRHTYLNEFYQKQFFVRSASTPSLSGFGLIHDGQDPDLVTFLSRSVFGTFATDSTRKRNLDAFLQCLDTGTAPATGHMLGLTAATLGSAEAEWTLLENQAATGNIDLVVHGEVNAERHGWRYRPATNDYLADAAGFGAVSREQMKNSILAGAVLTVMGVPPASGDRMSIDRNNNGTPDLDEPLPQLTLDWANALPRLTWRSEHYWLVLERNPSLDTQMWQPALDPRTSTDGVVTVLDAVSSHRSSSACGGRESCDNHNPAKPEPKW